MATLTLHPNVVLTARAGSPRSLNSLEKDCVSAILGRSSATTMQVRTQDRFTPFICGRGGRGGTEPSEEGSEGHPQGHLVQEQASQKETPASSAPGSPLAGSPFPRILSIKALEGAQAPGPHRALRASTGPAPHPGTPAHPHSGPCTPAWVSHPPLLCGVCRGRVGPLGTQRGAHSWVGVGIKGQGFPGSG